MLNRHALIYLVANGVPAALGFSALILYTHLVDPAEYGIYVIGQSIAAVASMAFFGWIRLAVGRYQAESPEIDSRGTVLVAYCSTLVVVVLAAALFALVGHPFVEPQQIWSIGFLAISLSMFELCQ